jgi:sortase A
MTVNDIVDAAFGRRRVAQGWSRAPEWPAARRLRRLALIALLAAGAASIVAGWWVPVKAELAQHLLSRSWAAAREDGTRSPPWPWADTWAVARLELPRVEPLTVLAGSSGRNLAFAPALMDGSAMPGSAGVGVIAGHRDTHFRALADLAVGERFTVELADGARLVYEITSIDVVDAERSALRLDAAESVVVLVTCYPFDAVAAGGNFRYLVTGTEAADGRVNPRGAF